MARKNACADLIRAGGRHWRGHDREHAVARGCARASRLAFQKRFAKNPAAMAWLWKDHTGVAEAGRSPVGRGDAAAVPRQVRRARIRANGSSARSCIAAALPGRCSRPPIVGGMRRLDSGDADRDGGAGPVDDRHLRRGSQGMYPRILGRLSRRGIPRAARPRMRVAAGTIASHGFDHRQVGGRVERGVGEAHGAPAGIPVAVGAFDAHLGAVGSGVAPGTRLVKIIGTSTCDITVSPCRSRWPTCRVCAASCRDRYLPGCHGLEAGSRRWATSSTGS
jgi:L-ribulokinase